MKAIKDIQLFFYNYFLTKARKASSIHRVPKPFEQAETVGILFDATEFERKELVQEYVKKLKKQEKKIKVLAFVDINEKNQNYAFPHFTNKELDWALRPKSEEIDNFIQQPFDLLLTLHPKPLLFFEYIAALSKSNLRVGPYTEQTYCYDLMIDTRQNDNLKDFIQQINFFLTKTNINYEPSTV